MTGFSSNMNNYPPGVSGREPQITGEPDVIDALVNACNGLLGLLQLISLRDDVRDDEGIYHALTKSHRIDEAHAAIRLAKGEQP